MKALRPNIQEQPAALAQSLDSSAPPGPDAYEALKALGHSPTKATEIVLDAARGDYFSRLWINMALAASP